MSIDYESNAKIQFSILNISHCKKHSWKYKNKVTILY